jgi:ATP-dependent Lon protease
MTSSETEFVSILGAAERAEATSRISSRSLPETLPILGLSDIVIFPGAVVPLLVETGPSLKLIDDIVTGDRLFGAILQRKPDVVEPAPEDLYEVGCVARLAKMVKFPDGTARVLVEGLWRIKVKNFQLPTPYLRANYELLRDETEESIELQAMLRNAHKQFEEIAKMSNALPDQVKIAALNTEHPGHFADLIAANLNLPLDDRQKLLEMVSVRERAKAVADAQPGAGSVDAQFEDTERRRLIHRQEPAGFLFAGALAGHPARVGRRRQWFHRGQNAS